MTFVTRVCQLVLWITFWASGFIALNPPQLDLRWAFIAIGTILAIIARNGSINQRIATEHIKSTKSLKH